MNRLAKETSPYLLQHKENPVDWYPWGEEALSRARQENKPILLSVGYSACHWCHVMAHECFETPAIAQIMNENFVNIKVDREERPDLDQIYQNVAQALTHGGGWPLTVFLTPDLKPFFGGTYFPPEDRYGRPGFPRVLESLSKAFRDDAPSVVMNAEKLTAYIGATEAIEKTTSQLPSWSQLEKIANLILSRIDFEDGGLGDAPKFPNTMSLSFLWRMAGFGAKKIEGPGKVDPTEDFHKAVTVSLTKMACGGIYDQIGGGFHRYSVDGTWSVPHFEKMLYDNALLLKLYAEVLLSDGPLSDPERLLYRKVLRETVDYLIREMRSPEGVFYAAQDADSEGEEGKFFAWSLQDLIHEAKLSLEEAKAFAMRYGISEQGNFEHGKTVLYFAQPLEVLAQKNPEFDAIQARCFEVRSKRVAPGRDDKVLTSWNGLAISGLIWAAAALEKDDPKTAKTAREAALNAYDFFASPLMNREGRLYSTFQGGKPKLNAYLDDYAFMAWAALDLARFDDGTRVKHLLQQSKVWVNHVLKHFSDPSAPGYFFTSDDHEKLIQRPKTIYDQAIPAGIALIVEALLVFDEMDLGGDSARYEAEWKAQLGQIYPQIEKSAFGFGELLCASLIAVKGPVAVSGPGSSLQARHAHVFQKEPSKGQMGQKLVCHRKTCGLAAGDDREFAAAVDSALK